MTTPPTKDAAAVAQTSVPTGTGRPMPLYLEGDDGRDDHWTPEQLDESRELLEEVTPNDRAHESLIGKPLPAHEQARPADRDADFARDVARDAPRESGLRPMAATAVSASDAGVTTILRGENDGGPGPGPEIMAAETLQGDRVMNLQGELLGKLRDIMIDVRHGRIAYAVMSSGGVMGFGDRLYALPWSALTMDAAQQCFLLDITRERLMEAPGFDRDRWPSMADTTFAQSVHAYYGKPSYWGSSRE